MGTSFVPALVVVDMQEDFCPPHGSLAVPDGRHVIPTIVSLLAAPFALRIATQDWHPPDHVSFASQHQKATAFETEVTLANPENPTETYAVRLWPDHCVQGSEGARIVHELSSYVRREHGGPAADARSDSFDHVVEKGTRRDVEMYSAFSSPLRAPRIGDSRLADLLRQAGVTHVYIVGLAADYCVRHTALDAVAEGFTALIVRQGTRAVRPETWEQCQGEMEQSGVTFVDLDGPEVARVKDYGATWSG